MDPIDCRTSYGTIYIIMEDGREMMAARRQTKCGFC
jgi:hypothetical protein